MIRLAIGFAALAALGPVTPASADGAASFRGYTAIDRIVRERITKSPVFNLGKDLELIRRKKGVLGLLGEYSGEGVDNRFRGGHPTPLSMMLWYITLSDFASGIGEHCEVSLRTKVPLRPEFEAALKPLCDWPAASARNASVLERLWRRLMAYDAPPTELEKWKEHFLSSDYPPAPASQVVAEMVLTALYNPYFLLSN